MDMHFLSHWGETGLFHNMERGTDKNVRASTNQNPPHPILPCIPNSARQNTPYL